MIHARSRAVPHQVEFTTGTHVALADVPVEKGGAGAGFGPHELLEAALATCLVMTARMVAEKHDLPLESAECQVRIDRTNPDAACLEYNLTLHGRLNPDQQARIHEAVRRCPVARTLGGDLAIRPGSASHTQTG